ncbi:hypothetical protein [Mesoterricola silvestris]|uniref:Uncharacterized protein n=1 Tax=Mesoterricola silvestris TaxID=2927979 RepID=A0AA48GTC0_9BACT|nr:hypothetical protein [Mesoterricola silvestris]BDU73950.1 hypothetical protein METEAL_31240 [Mesoterricola silvestris]
MRLPTWTLAASMAVLCAPPILADAGDDLGRRITSLHTRVYGQENLLLKPFEKTPLDDVSDWRRLMRDVRAYLQENSPRADMLEAMRAMDAASEGLIEERDRSWVQAVRKCILLPNPDAGLSRIDREKLRLSALDLKDVILGSARLQNLSRKMVTAKDAIKRDRNPSAKVKACLGLCDRLVLTLQMTLDKFHSDLVKLKNAKG